jgi:hypothetical protein
MALAFGVLTVVAVMNFSWDIVSGCKDALASFMQLHAILSALSGAGVVLLCFGSPALRAVKLPDSRC